MSISFRRWVKDDVAFVMSNWLRSFRNTPWAGCIPNHLYYDTYRVAVEQLIARGATIEVAEFSGRLLGFAASEVTRDGRSVIHALYVKDPFQSRGIDRELVNRASGTKPGFYTFRTPQLERALDRNWTHAPEIARRR